MANKKTYFLITVECLGLHYSYAFAHNNSVNLASYIDAFHDAAVRIDTLNPCGTKKEAVETAKCWNAAWESKDILWKNPIIIGDVCWN